MPEFILGARESIQTAEQRNTAHGWVASLADDLLTKAGTDRYAEYTLHTCAAAVVEMLGAMTLDDLAVSPGDRLGPTLPAEWEDNNKMGLFYGWSLVVPPEPSRIYVVSSAEEYDPAEPKLRYVGLAQEYSLPSSTYRQIVGVTARPGGSIEAVRIGYGEDAAGVTMGRDDISRPITYNDTKIFVDCMREFFALSRE